jgi:hypothetical protein
LDHLLSKETWKTGLRRQNQEDCRQALLLDVNKATSAPSHHLDTAANTPAPLEGSLEFWANLRERRHKPFPPFQRGGRQRATKRLGHLLRETTAKAAISERTAKAAMLSRTTADKVAGYALSTPPNPPFARGGKCCDDVQSTEFFRLRSLAAGRCRAKHGFTPWSEMDQEGRSNPSSVL